VVSGGHTVLIHWKAPGDIELIGKTMDDAAGEAFDKVGKMLGLGYPGGPVIDRISRDSQVSPGAFQFPRSQMNEDHLDFSFSGLKTSVFYKVAALEKEGPLTDRTKAEVAAGFQEAACEVLTSKAVRACRARKVKRLVVGGGVSANSRLQELLRKAAGPEKLQVVFPGVKLSVDNAVMIAALGGEMARVKSKRLGMPAKGRAALLFEPYSDFFGRKFFYTHSRRGRIK
jgi:N6-L-threonylcarbamoyladenine synthase